MGRAISSKGEGPVSTESPRDGLGPTDYLRNSIQYFPVFGEAAGFQLAPHAPTVKVDVENPAAPCNDFRLDAELAFNRLRQTGGPGKIVSLGAVLDANLHGHSVS